MKNLFSKLQNNQIERLFPYYFLLDSRLQIIEFGNGLSNLLAGYQNENFNKVFQVINASKENLQFNDFAEANNLEILLQTKDLEKNQLRTQIVHITEDNVLLFYVVSEPNYIEKKQARTNQFLATISHEIRTPLNAIIGLTNYMLLKKPKGETKENLDILSFSANNLLALITDVLDLSKIGAGKIDFVKTDFDLKHIVAGVHQTYLTKCELKGLQFTYKIDNNVPHYLIGDSLRLTQVLNNLVSNAIKFTEHGEITLHVTKTGMKGNAHCLLFQITDTGIGIRKGEIKNIFDDFEQANNSINQNYGGTGVGLAISKNLVELQGGIIGVESTANKGSCFYFELAFEESSVADQFIEEKTSGILPQFANLKQAKILLVEDNIVNQRVAVSFIKYWGAEVTCANNGLEAFTLFKEQPFDLLLVDLFMPIMNGFEAIQNIRALETGKTVPIIALTASAETSSMDKAMAAGANICLTKPFNADQLREKISELLGTENNSIGTIGNASNLTNNTTQFHYIDLTKLTDAALGSMSFMKEMLSILGSEIPTLIVDAEQQIAKKEYDTFSTTIHKLKNNLLVLGLEMLRDDLTFMEENIHEDNQQGEVLRLFNKLKLTWDKARQEVQQALVELK
ncbi:MAG: ATP-binding protein [Bacteroidota bacterium]